MLSLSLSLGNSIRRNSKLTIQPGCSRVSRLTRFVIATNCTEKFFWRIKNENYPLEIVNGRTDGYRVHDIADTGTAVATFEEPAAIPVPRKQQTRNNTIITDYLEFV